MDTEEVIVGEVYYYSPLGRMKTICEVLKVKEESAVVEINGTCKIVQVKDLERIKVKESDPDMPFPAHVLARKAYATKIEEGKVDPPRTTSDHPSVTTVYNMETVNMSGPDQWGQYTFSAKEDSSDGIVNPQYAKTKVIEAIENLSEALKLVSDATLRANAQMQLLGILLEVSKNG